MTTPRMGESNPDGALFAPEWPVALISDGISEARIVYIGPDALMPLASALAAVVGFLLMFWRRFVGLMRLVFGRVASLFGKR